MCKISEICELALVRGYNFCHVVEFLQSSIDRSADKLLWFTGSLTETCSLVDWVFHNPPKVIFVWKIISVNNFQSRICEWQTRAWQTLPFILRSQRIYGACLREQNETEKYNKCKFQFLYHNLQDSCSTECHWTHVTSLQYDCTNQINPSGPF